MRIQSVHSAKRAGRRGKGRNLQRIPRAGSQLRGFWDALQDTARTGGMVPILDRADRDRKQCQAEYLTIFYGLDISRVHDTTKPYRPIVGFRLIGEWIDNDYVTVFTYPETT